MLSICCSLSLFRSVQVVDAWENGRLSFLFASVSKPFTSLIQKKLHLKISVLSCHWLCNFEFMRIKFISSAHLQFSTLLLSESYVHSCAVQYINFSFTICVFERRVTFVSVSFSNRSFAGVCAVFLLPYGWSSHFDKMLSIYQPLAWWWKWN